MKRRQAIYCFLFLLTGFSLQAQFRTKEETGKPYTFNLQKTHGPQSWLAKQTMPAYLPPMLSGLGASSFSTQSAYWLSQITTQTMNKGTMGTLYMWDQQGNLRESRFFVDIGGRRNPGFKLVVPRR
jgi:hypothetical protein